MFEAHVVAGVTDVENYPFYWLYNILLCTLLVLHWIWFIIIASIAKKAILTGKVGAIIKVKVSLNSSGALFCKKR